MVAAVDVFALCLPQLFVSYIIICSVFWQFFYFFYVVPTMSVYHLQKVSIDLFYVLHYAFAFLHDVTNYHSLLTEGRFVTTCIIRIYIISFL